MVISTKWIELSLLEDIISIILKISKISKRHTNIPAHCSPAFKRIKVGDIVTIGQCRPLSKTVRFNVLKVQPNIVYGNVKKQFKLF